MSTLTERGQHAAHFHNAVKTVARRQAEWTEYGGDQLNHAAVSAILRDLGYEGRFTLPEIVEIRCQASKLNRLHESAKPAPEARPQGLDGLDRFDIGEFLDDTEELEANNANLKAVIGKLQLAVAEAEHAAAIARAERDAALKLAAERSAATVLIAEERACAWAEARTWKGVARREQGRLNSLVAINRAAGIRVKFCVATPN